MRELGEIIRAIIRNRTADWDKIIPTVETSINTARNRSIGMSPFEALFGFPMRSPLAVMTGANPQLAAGGDLTQHRVLLQAVRALVQVRSERAAAQAKAAYDAAHTIVNFNVNDRVLVYNPDRDNKLLSFWRGPYAVLSKLSDNEYRVQDIDSKREFNAHVTRMMPFDMSRTSDIEEIEAHADADRYIVESVLGHRHRDGRLELHIKWKYYPVEEATWEPAANPDFKFISCVQDYISGRNLSLTVPRPSGRGRRA
jgi:hypothetical protein